MIDPVRGKGGFPVDAEAIWRAALAAVDPWTLVRESVERQGDVIRIKDREFDLAAFERVFILSFGKAASAMGEALAAILDERLTSGLAIVPWPVGKDPSRLEHIEAAHPIPDARSVEAARRALEIVPGFDRIYVRTNGTLLNMRINPDCVRSQVEGNILQTLSRTLFEEVRFDRFRVTSVNWASYPILTFPDVPALDIDLVDRPDLPPLGVGEASCAAAKAGEQRNTTMTIETRIWGLVLMRVCSRFSCGYQHEPFRKLNHCASSFSATGESRPRMHWRSPPREFL